MPNADYDSVVLLICFGYDLRGAFFFSSPLNDFVLPLNVFFILLIWNDNFAYSLVSSSSLRHLVLLILHPVIELWALLNFLIPEIFGSADHFDEWFSLTDEKGQENVIKKLHTVLRPFMLRRVKKDVATSLPPKKETKLYIGMTPMQQEWYVKVLQKDAHLLNSLDGPERVRLLNVLSKWVEDSVGGWSSVCEVVTTSVIGPRPLLHFGLLLMTSPFYPFLFLLSATS
jgi:hypothetical protein